MLDLSAVVRMRCPKCRHEWRNHETTGWPTPENPEPHDECGVNMGMGNWCACKEKRPAGWSDVEDVIQQVESSTRMYGPSNNIVGYVIDADQWRALRAQLRRNQ